jgi:arylsulfatase A-like enzyme
MTWLRTEHPDLVDIFRTPRPTSPARTAGDRSGGVLDAPWQASHSGWIATEADRYLRGRAAAGGQMVHLGFYAPHPPLNPTAEMFEPYADVALPPVICGKDEAADKPEPLKRMLQNPWNLNDEVIDRYRRHFAAMVTGVDLAVGQVLARLEAEAALDDTLIVFTSDHGDMCGDHTMILKGAHFFDQVLRVPCVIHWPAGIGTSAGRRAEGLFEMVDLLPTMLDLCELPIPRAMAGRSVAEALRTGRTPEPREDVYAFHHLNLAMVRTERAKLIRFGTADREVLYCLGKDPGELVNRAADPTCADLRNEMRDRLLQRTLDACRSPLPRHSHY